MPEQENNILDAPQEPLLTRIDTALTHGIKLIIGFFYQALLWVLGASLTAVLLADIFEHSAGLDDLSREEILFLLISTLLIRRSFRHGRLRGYRWWSGLNRIMTSTGIISLMLLGVTGAITLLLSNDTGDLRQMIHLLRNPLTPVTTIGAHLIFLSGIYFSIPTRNKQNTPKRESCITPAAETQITTETPA